MDWPAVFWISLMVAALVGMAAHAIHKAALVRRSLREFTESAGLADVRRSMADTNELFARWGGYAVSLRWIPRHKTRPELLMTTVRVQAGSARLLVTRRGYEWFERPISLFGPPLVESPGANQFWVRTNEPAVAEVIFADAALVRLLEQNVAESADVLEFFAGGMQIRRMVRAMDVQTLAEEEWALAVRLIDVLGLSPLV